jgi:hypothetical protein
MKIMKNKIRLLTAFTIVLSLLFVTCKKDKDEFSAEDAKVEIRSASQKIQANLSTMMTTPAMQSLDFLMGLMDFEDDWKSSLKSAAQDVETINLISINKLLRENLHLKIDEIDPEDGGEYTYNFTTEQFDLTDETISYLLIIFPADDIAYANEQNNGSLKLENLVIEEIEYTDEWDTYYEDVLTSVDATLTVDSQVAMTCSYRATLNNEGLPVSATFNMTMAPYQMTLTQTGSGVNYTSTASLKMGNDVLMSYNMNIKYTAQQDDVDNVSGNFQITPLRFEGNIKAAAMDNCSENDLNCMNNNLDVEVIHTEKNKIIGHLEFRMFYDSYWDEEYPELVIVYSDGTYEWLYVALGLEFEDLKRGLMKK